MGEKYKLTEETKKHNGKILRRIQAARDFGDVKAGDLGGWIENENNLSQYEYCWVYDDAMVFENAQVYGKAKVYENAKVYGYAWVYETACVYGNSQIYGYTSICGKAKIYENAKVYGIVEVCGNSEIYGNAQVYGISEICGNAEVYGNAEVCKNARLKEKTDFICIYPIGSRRDSLTFYKTNDGTYVMTCCFNGSDGIGWKEVLELTNTEKANKNIGYGNSGSGNVGSFNQGSYNLGNHNKADYCIGDFNTKNLDCLSLFNKPIERRYFEYWRNSIVFEIFDSINLCFKKPNGETAIAPLKGAYRLWWDNLNMLDKEIILENPYFNAEVFKEITSIDVNSKGKRRNLPK